MLSMQVDTAKVTALQNKISRFGPYASKIGLKATADYFNDNNFKAGMYAPNQNGSPFMWSSDRQRRYVYANVDLPYSRTMQLANSGEFKVNENNFWVEYTNSSPAWIYILHPSYMIIGHRTRGWKPVNQQVVEKAPTVLQLFKQAVLSAWNSFTG